MLQDVYFCSVAAVPLFSAQCYCLCACFTVLQ